MSGDVVVSGNGREWRIWRFQRSFLQIWRQAKKAGFLELQSWSGSSVHSLHILSVLWKQINGTVGVTLLLSVRYKKYRLALISTVSAQLCCLWGLCVCACCVFTWNSCPFLHFVFHFSYFLHLCGLCVTNMAFLSNVLSFYQWFYVCVCVHVCLCVQTRSCQALAACIDVVMEVFLILSWHSAAPNGQLKTILWWFYGLLHVLHQNFVTWCAKKIWYYSASFFFLVIRQIYPITKAHYVIHRHFSIIFGKFSVYSTSVPGSGVLLLINHVPGTGSIFHAVKMAKLDHMAETDHSGSSQ